MSKKLLLIPMMAALFVTGACNKKSEPSSETPTVSLEDLRDRFLHMSNCTNHMGVLMDDKTKEEEYYISSYCMASTKQALIGITQEAISIAKELRKHESKSEGYSKSSKNLVKAMKSTRLMSAVFDANYFGRPEDIERMFNSLFDLSNQSQRIFLLEEVKDYLDEPIAYGQDVPTEKICKYSQINPELYVRIRKLFPVRYLERFLSIAQISHGYSQMWEIDQIDIDSINGGKLALLTRNFEAHSGLLVKEKMKLLVSKEFADNSLLIANGDWFGQDYLPAIKLSCLMSQTIEMPEVQTVLKAGKITGLYVSVSEYNYLTQKPANLKTTEMAPVPTEKKTDYLKASHMLTIPPNMLSATKPQELLDLFKANSQTK